jgi:two-component system, NarL family, nitrate/nitrite response regulator NarL
MNRPLRVYIADDHPVYREGLARHWETSTDITVVGSTGDGAAVVSGIIAASPDVAIVDLLLPNQNGLAILEDLRRRKQSAAVLILTAYVDSATVYNTLAAGARGFLEKAASFDEITQAVLSIAKGDNVIAPMVSGALVDEIREREAETRAVLTDREVAVMKLAADGLSSQQIARQLAVGLPTVKSHLTHIYSKLNVPDRASAVAKAFRLGLLS